MVRNGRTSNGAEIKVMELSFNLARGCGNRISPEVATEIGFAPVPTRNAEGMECTHTQPNTKENVPLGGLFSRQPRKSSLKTGYVS